MNTLRKQRGGIAAFAILSMTVLLTVGVGVAGLTVQSVRRSKRDTRAAVAFQAAQAGLDYRVAKSFSELETTSGEFVDSSFSESDRISPIAPGATGTSTVKPTADPTRAWITCNSTFDGYTRSVRVFAWSQNVGIWNNAVFAGTGASGQAINGNVDIRGSMHLLGDGEAYSDLNGNGQRDAGEDFTDSNGNGVWDPGEPFVDTNGDGVRNPPEPYNDSNNNGIYDPPLTQTDMNSSFGGNAYVGNNYSGMPAGLEALVTPPPIVNGLETLGAEVRVKHGRISISGTASIGSASIIDGGTSKARIDGSYVNDGYTGTAGASSVFSENGTANGYDLNNLGMQYPLISGIGSQPYKDRTGVTWANQELFLNARTLLIPVNTITATTPAFSYGPDAYGNSISFTPESGTNPALLTVTGIVRVAGDLQLGAKDTIRTAGKGTIYSPQDIKVDGNLLPRDGLVFPTATGLGLIAKRNMLLACGNGSSQLSLVGAFYAQGIIKSAKQNQIAGTFVANFFDMGTNVPNIYQVPKLPRNMPPGMPGDRAYYNLKIQSWRERASSVGG